MADQIYDVAILGAGPGGYVAAIRCAQLGKKVVVVEANHLGGICLNWGCIPTKALLRSAEVYHTIQNSEDFGISVKDVKFDFDKIVKRSRAVSEQLTKGIQHLLKKNKVDVQNGFGRLKGKTGSYHKLSVTDSNGQVSEITAAKVILATGARARVIPGLEPDGQDIWTYKEAMVPKAMPKSLLVIGSGAIGIEFASFYATMGVDVTVVELLDRILPVEDEEISKLARKAFEKKGVKIHTGAVVKKLAKDKKAVVAEMQFQDGAVQQISFDKVIVAVGIVGNTEDLGLELTKVKVDKNQIQVNEYCQTDEPGIYAIGDVAGAPWLAHKASHEGVMVAEHMAGSKDVHPMNRLNIPGCTYSSPQVASVGLTEASAKAKGYSLKVGRFPFAGNGKALAMGEPEGLVKTIFDEKTGELLGAHMIGTEVTEMIQGYVIAKTMEATESELMQTIFPHPTLSEMMHESVLDAYGRVIHM